MPNIPFIRKKEEGQTGKKENEETQTELKNRRFSKEDLVKLNEAHEKSKLKNRECLEEFKNSNDLLKRLIIMSMSRGGIEEEIAERVLLEREKLQSEISELTEMIKDQPDFTASFSPEAKKLEESRREEVYEYLDKAQKHFEKTLEFSRLKKIPKKLLEISQEICTLSEEMPENIQRDLLQSSKEISELVLSLGEDKPNIKFNKYMRLGVDSFNNERFKELCEYFSPWPRGYIPLMLMQIAEDIDEKSKSVSLKFRTPLQKRADYIAKTVGEMRINKDYLSELTTGET